MKRIVLLFCIAAFAGAFALFDQWQDEAQAAVSPNIVINQVYGGGGVAAQSPFRNDFIELFNRGSIPVSLSGWSVQFSHSDSSSWSTTALPNVTLQPGQYFLVQQGSSGANGVLLPTPDVTATINMHPINGRVALVNSTTALSGACPITNSSIVDFFGYGNSACFEGLAGLANMTIDTAGKRNASGCVDTDQNSADFTVATPTPRNTSSPVANCGSIEFPLMMSAAASPNAVAPNATVLFTANVTPGTNPTSTGITVRGDLTAMGGSANQQFFDDGTNGDVTPGDNVFSFAYLVPATLTGGPRNVAITATDAQSRTASTQVTVIINAPFAEDDHILLGNPSNATTSVTDENNYLMYKPQYVLSYNRSRATANWVAWRLDSSWIGGAQRQDDFRPDPALPAGWYAVSTGDSSGSGYDRGHMTPSGDRTRSIPDNSATFLMTNIVPQYSNNNQGPWEEFETYCRSLVSQGNEIYIYSGVQGNIGTIAGGRIVVPANTWKVVLVLPNGDNDLSRINKGTRAFGIIVPNQGPLDINAPWRNFRVTVDAVENLTGYDFFTSIPKNTQELIEKRRDRL